MRQNSGTPWPIAVLVAILIAIIGVFAAQPQLLCEVLDIGCPPEPTQPPPSASGIDGIYWMDNDRNREVVVTYLSGNTYRIEEHTSPWPWEGTAVLSGASLSGSAEFIKTGGKMNVEGDVRSDGTIRIDYTFPDDPGRVDSHIWYPAD